MGAFIQLKEPPKNKRILLDIGIAGPLAGLVVAIPVLLYRAVALHGQHDHRPARAGLFSWKATRCSICWPNTSCLGSCCPRRPATAALSPLLYWMRYFFTGQPLPLGGMDVMIHPVAWAGWAGLLVTALNLIPAGQLDGGHLLYVLLGKRARMLLAVHPGRPGRCWASSGPAGGCGPA